MIHNPIIPGFNPDPSITFDGKQYIIATSTFEYYPGVSLYVSSDLSKWHYKTSVLTSENNFNLSGARNSSGIYAATIRYHEGRYYMVTTNKNGFGNLISSADDISGPWSEPQFIHRTGIDPSLLFLEDGRCFYTQNGKGGIYGAFIDPETGRLLDELQLISPGLSGYATEAPHIYQKDRMYYLVFAEGGTEYGHHEVVGRARNIFGPYELRKTPVLSHVSRKGHIIQAAGHADLIALEDGRWIAVFLAIRVPGKAMLHNLGRETFMAEVNWIDNWPVIGDDGNVELEMPSDIETGKETSFYFNYADDISKYPILRVRRENAENYERIGNDLLFHGTDKITKDLGEPALLLVRQEEFDCIFTAELSLDHLSGCAGVTVFYNSDYNASLCALKRQGDIILQYRRKIHDLKTVVSERKICECSSIRFEIHSNREGYEFYANGEPMGSASIASFSSEATMYMTFTGTMFGVFAENGDAVFINGFGFKAL